MAYGIDDVVQKKVDAYRGNPAALQQRYAQNQELVDLLALQKMKSEKESAAWARKNGFGYLLGGGGRRGSTTSRGKTNFN